MTDGTRQSPPSLGHPRLIFSLGGMMSSLEPPREFALVDDLTTIGSDPRSDLMIDGLDGEHAEIRRDEHDDYTYTPLCGAADASVHGRPATSAVLRTGARIELGMHTVSFYREEFADKSVGVDSFPGVKFAQMRADALTAGIAEAAQMDPPAGRDEV